MKTMITLSLILNVLVLIPVCAGLIINAGWAQASYGERSPARGILLAIYLAILSSSVILLVFANSQYAVALLTIQVFYKLVSPVTVGTFKNPVVISNLAIAVFHAISLIVIWKASGYLPA